MLFVNYCTYVLDTPKVAAVRPDHREYIARLFEESKILACWTFCGRHRGPFHLRRPR